MSWIIVGCIIVGFLLYRSWSDVGSREFKASVDDERLYFFSRVFDITRDELLQLRFDGHHFHHRSQVELAGYANVHFDGTWLTNTWNTSLPHSSSYRFARIDGGPDRRYNNNTVTRTTQRSTLRFTGESRTKLSLYSYPGSQVDERLTQLASRATGMLTIAKLSDFQSELGKYSAACALSRSFAVPLERNHAERQRHLGRIYKPSTPTKFDAMDQCEARFAQDDALIQLDSQLSQLMLARLPAEKEMSRAVACARQLAERQRRTSTVSR